MMPQQRATLIQPRSGVMVMFLLLTSAVARPGDVNGSTLRRVWNGGNGDVAIGEAYELWTERLAVLVHTWAKAGGAECECIKLRTAALPSSAPRRGN